jgi:DNA-binding FadR family transcriptional regulator
LEIGSVGDAVTNATEKDIEDIRSAMRKLEAFAVKKVKTLAEYELLELEFHQAIVKPSGNQILALVNVALKNYFSVSFSTKIARSHSSMSNLKREHLEHCMLTYAFELKWPEIAEACLRKHLSH